jgi:acetoin utilization deacetylase AcuC-like enzyme
MATGFVWHERYMWHDTGSLAGVLPPGHHAEPDRGRGFCIFGNVALGVMHARAVRDIQRVAVVDWDVHHGNGTQAAFYEDPAVLTISIHKDRNYPLESGSLDERGRGAGEGYNLNVPLPPGSGHGAYVATFERVVEPALRSFRPELILVASGFDASSTDPLGRMLCSSETYREMVRRLLEAASTCCGGRLLLCHEGGYSNMSVPACGLAVIEELSGHRTGVRDAGALLVQATAGYALEPHQEVVIDRAAQLAARISV